MENGEIGFLRVRTADSKYLYFFAGESLDHNMGREKGGLREPSTTHGLDGVLLRLVPISHKSTQ